MLRYEKKNKPFAQENRKQRNATKQEGVLWHTFLKNCPVRFLRQYRINDYILDFYAPSIKLAIELDGSQHGEEENAKYDKLRTEELEKLGIYVLRFTNYEIDRKLKLITEQIVYVIEQRVVKPIF